MPLFLDPLWRKLKIILFLIRNIFDSNGFSLFLFVLASLVLIFVPQFANLWWVLPFLHDRGQELPHDEWISAVGFWFYVPAIALFYFVFWLTLLRAGGFRLTRLATAIGLILMGLLILAPGVDALWNDHFKNQGWTILIFRVALLLFNVLYFFSWLLLLKPGAYLSKTFVKTRVPSKLRRAFFRLRQPLWWKPASRVDSVHPLVVPAWLRWVLLPVTLIAIPLACVNLLFLLLHYVLCGFWIAVVRQFPRTCTLVACVSLLVIYFLDQHFSHEGGMAQDPAGAAIFDLMMMLLFLLGAWMFLVALHEPPLSPVGAVTGRILVFHLTACLLGVFLWKAPELGYFSNYFSYRLYTIWVAFHLGYGLITLGTLADVCHREWRGMPVRPVTLLLLVGAAVFIVKSTDLEKSGQEKGEKIWAQRFEQDQTPAASLNWYRNVWKRLQAIEEKGQGPIIVVSASGGGSRAALFTALVLQGMQKEAFQTLEADKRCTWADRILFISSVSGGSLATADYTFRDHSRGNQRDALHNSLKSELIKRFAHEYENIKPSYAAEKLNKTDQPFAALYHAHDFQKSDADLQWMFTSAYVDDMCTDFMAPLLRGLFSFQVERGESVSRFWHQRFHWIDQDQSVVHNLSHDPARPLLVFNATDAQRGNRFLLGFPQLPRRMATMHLARIPNVEIQLRGVLKADDPRLTVFASQAFKEHQVAMRIGHSYTLTMEREDKTQRPKQGRDPRLDPFLIVLDPTGKKVVAYDDDSGGDRNARITDFIPESDGQHRVLATAYNENRGAYTLTVSQKPTTSPLIARSAYVSYNPNYPYTQTLSDFWPSYYLELTKAVRASANFPWGFQSCYLTQHAKKYDFHDPELRQTLCAAANIEALLRLLPDELNLLGLETYPDFDFQVDGHKAVQREEFVQRLHQRLCETDYQKRPDEHVEKLNQIARALNDLTFDPHVRKEARTEAKKILDSLMDDQTTEAQERVYLLDGGVNDNTGMPTLAELLMHLETVAHTVDPLVDAENGELARKIMDRLRKRGVIYLEIDSGAKPKSGVANELKKPLQGLENVAFVQALEVRGRYLKQINQLLAYRRTGQDAGNGLETSHASEDLRWVLSALFKKEADTKLEAKKAGAIDVQGIVAYFLKREVEAHAAAKRAEEKDVPWIFPHLFLCNLSSDHDVMTAWALSPEDKAHVMGTFFYEFQKWRADQSANLPRWRAARAKAIHAPLKDEEGHPLYPIWELEKFGHEVLRTNERQRIEQQAIIRNEQKMRKEK